MLKSDVKGYFSMPRKSSIVGNTKLCSCCTERKELEEFYAIKAGSGYSSKCIMCTIAYAIQYQLDHKEETKAGSARRYAKNPQKFISVVLADAKANPAAFAARAMNRVTAKLLRTPKWLTSLQLDEIKRIYATASYKTATTGVKHEVDHIVPLQGKNVSGLHVPWNLQVITTSANRHKGNR